MPLPFLLLQLVFSGFSNLSHMMAVNAINNHPLLNRDLIIMFLWAVSWCQVPLTQPSLLRDAGRFKISPPPSERSPSVSPSSSFWRKGLTGSVSSSSPFFFFAFVFTAAAAGFFCVLSFSGCWSSERPDDDPDAWNFGGSPGLRVASKAH